MVDARLRQKDRRRLVLVGDERGPDEESWIKERERYYAAGSYAALVGCLSRLASLYPWRYALLLHYVTETDSTIWSWSEKSLKQIEETIDWVAEEMPRPIRVPSWVRQSYKRTVSRGSS